MIGLLAAQVGGCLDEAAECVDGSLCRIGTRCVVLPSGVTSVVRLFEPLRREVTRRAFKPAVQVCRIVPGELTGVAGVYGAARAFQEQVEAGIV